ncbi:hypothetical protein DFH09DRAFT_1067117 [Mycena vulgaris]|nr:hypothetical protein DFH09DRAFT_1113830 [Mycena vulgaris]KAJ6606244.1 hypothetical protein DFH09DRAFT_1067117 [Mycena vulgaris]
MSSASSSQFSLLSVTISATDSVPTSGSESNPKKDYLAAFGTLQSNYGIAAGLGGAPAAAAKNGKKSSGVREGVRNLLKKIMTLASKVLRSNGSKPTPTRHRWEPAPQASIPNHCLAL